MKTRTYYFFSLLSFLFLLFALVFHFHIKYLPLLCLLLGILIRIVFSSAYLSVFSFLIPLLPGLASLEKNGFPLNYLLLPLFVLFGIMVREVAVKKDWHSNPLLELPRFYSTFLLLLGISFIYVMLRWSNLTLSPLAFFKDTPIASTGQRISFGIIFPVVELALFSLSPFYYLLLKRQTDLRRILIAFLSGQSLSITYSLFQHLQAQVSQETVLRGLASDPTAFGFMSTLAILLAWYLYFHYSEKCLGIFFIFVSLIGIMNSATRIGFIAVVLVIFLFIFSSRKKIISAILIGFLLAAAFILYVNFFYQPGFNFFTRLKNNIDDLTSIRPGQGGVWVKYSKTGAWAKLSAMGRDIITGDMNGDGQKELLATWDGQGVYWRKNSSGAWTKLASPATMITSADLDNDGTDDLIGVWPSQGGIWGKYSKTGAWAKLSISTTARNIATGDMNGDNQKELLATWDGQGVFYMNNCTGAWVKMATPATQVTSGDLDGDGTDDLIGIWPGQGGVWSKFSKTNVWIKLGSTARRIATGDMNGDGKKELLGTWDGKGTFWRNNITGAWIRLTIPTTMLATCDLDGDKTDDLIGIWPEQVDKFDKNTQMSTGANFISIVKRFASSTFMAITGALTLKKLSSDQWNDLTSGRMVIWEYSWEWFRSFPLTGLGIGNFVFWVMSIHGNDYIHHLPANQYFLIMSSTGALGILFFLFFCFGLFSFKKWPEKYLIGAVLFLLLFNDYLWFSEIFLAFWLVASLGYKESKAACAKKISIWPTMTVLAVFVIANLFSFNSLHPRNWARMTSTVYDYGFYYQESENGQSFRWTGGKAGIYIYLDRHGRSADYDLVCGAPLRQLPNGKQTVDIYWRGRFFKSVVFRDNGRFSLQIEDHIHNEGFLEFRVRPTFNLERMGLGAETRNLGIQLSGGDK